MISAAFVVYGAYWLNWTQMRSGIVRLGGRADILMANAGICKHQALRLPMLAGG